MNRWIVDEWWFMMNHDDVPKMVILSSSTLYIHIYIYVYISILNDFRGYYKLLLCNNGIHLWVVFRCLLQILRWLWLISTMQSKFALFLGFNGKMGRFYLQCTRRMELIVLSMELMVPWKDNQKLVTFTMEDNLKLVIFFTRTMAMCQIYG